MKAKAFSFVVLAAVVCAVIVDHALAGWMGLSRDGATYRRIGPLESKQIFCAGSSVLQFGLQWRKVSTLFDKGIESWGIGGSSPSEWEQSQPLATNSDLAIIGVSLFDLNEFNICKAKAAVVPFRRTVVDLWKSSPSWDFSKRLLSQYLLSFSRLFFPTAGRSDAAMVRTRDKIRSILGRTQRSGEDNVEVLPSGPILEFGGLKRQLSTWPKGRLVRRLALLRASMDDRHAFNGPKKLALTRMIHTALRAGNVIVVVMPMAPTYVNNLVTSSELEQFEFLIGELQANYPSVTFVRLDRWPALRVDDVFSDFVHLNGDGRDIATAAFIEVMRPQFLAE